MSRIQDLLDEATARVPERPGDLEAVRSRARKRQLQRRGADVLVAVALAAAITVTVVTSRTPEVPVIGSDAEVEVLQLQFCPALRCDTMPMSPDEAIAVLSTDPEVDAIRLLSAEEVRDSAVGELGSDPSEWPLEGFAPVLEVELRGNEPILDVALRFDAAVPGISIATGRVDETHTGPLGTPEAPFDARAIIGERSTIASHGTIDLQVWRVRGGGVCYAVGELTSCHRHRLNTSVSPAAWGRTHAEDTPHCVWGQAAAQETSVTVTWDDGHRTDAALGRAPRTLLGQGFLACAETDRYPIAIEAQAPGAGAELGASPGSSVVDEVRREGDRPLLELLVHLEGELAAAGVEDAIAAIAGDTPAGRDRAVEALRQALEQLTVPASFEALALVEVGLDDVRDDGRTHAFGVIEARGATDPPLCVGASIDVEEPERDGVILRNLVTTSAGCSHPRPPR